MIWLLALVGVVVIVAIALGSVGAVTRRLETEVQPSLLRVDDAVEAVADGLPFEVSAVLSHDDVEEVVRWVLDWFDELGLASEFGEELGGEWVADDRVVADEIGAGEYAVARGLTNRPDLDSVHITVVVDALMQWLRDIGAVGGEVQ